MTDWFECGCGHVFDRSTADVRQSVDCAEFWGEIKVIKSLYIICPACGSDELKDFVPCVGCVVENNRTPNRALHGIDHCADCYRREFPEDFADYFYRWPEDVPKEVRHDQRGFISDR